MTSKHTPGPWFVQPGFLTIYNMDGGDYGLTCAVASVLDKQPGRDAAEANARLIAAAPDLLEALKHARSQMQHPDQMIDEAIAKAEGTP